MIRINIEGLDNLTDLFVRLNSDTDNILGKTTMLRNEMLEDPDLMALSNSADIISIMDAAVSNLTQLHEDIQYLDNLFIKAKDDFSDNEKELIKSIDEISNRLNSIKIQLDSALISEQAVVIDRSELDSPVNDVERLVAGSVAELELTNIAALSQLADAQARAREVRDKE